MKSIALILFAIAAPACFGATPVTLPEAQRRALEHSRMLPAFDAAAVAARERAVAAGQLPDPVLRVGVDNIPIEGGDKFSLTRDFMTMRRIGLMQELTASDKRDLRRQRYEFEGDKSSAERSAARTAIQRDAALAWLDRFHQEAMLAVTAELASRTELEVQSADAAYRGGRGTQSEVFAARAALALAKDRQDETLRRVRAARIELSRWTGSAPDEPLGPAPEMGEVPVGAVAIEGYLGAHPEIVALDRGARISAVEARIAAAAKRPDWTVEASYQQRGPAYSNMFSIGVSIPLPWDAANRQDREVAARLANVAEAEARRDELLRTHVAEVAGMLEEWSSGRARQARYRAEILPLTRERTNAVIAAFAGGKASLAEVLAARKGESDARLQSLQLDLEVARAWARLTFLLPDDASHFNIQRSH